MAGPCSSSWLGVYGLPRWNFLGAKIIQKMIGCSFVEWLVRQESARCGCKALRMCELWITIFFSYGRNVYVGILQVCHFGQSHFGQTQIGQLVLRWKKVLKIVYINKTFYLYILFLDMKIYFKSRVWPKWLWPLWHHLGIVCVLRIRAFICGGK